MRMVDKYNMLFHKYNFSGSHNDNIVNAVVRDSLKKFAAKCSNPAIWCHGEHTRMLMRDYVFEMKQVKYIIDKDYNNIGECGYHVIGSNQIKDCGIDGIIISTYRYREEIKNQIKQECPDIAYIDIYEELEKRGIALDREYYSRNGASYYIKINQLKRECYKKDSDVEKLYLDIINEYINMMDFQSAIVCAQNLQKINNISLYQELRQDLEEIYQMELAEIAKISQSNVLMFCIDGLRRQDVLGNCMPNLKKYLMEHTRLYANAYSVSTSTFESLIPTYSENNDMRTKYYETNIVDEKDCRFITEAIKQGRNIYFYTDAQKYIESDNIKVSNAHQMATEKIWNFIVDAAEEENGLFYIHVLFESHFAFQNPDTEAELVVDGTGIMQDYLERKGGKIRADYVQQHTDAMKYLDRVLSPFLERISCRLVLYADHGNILIPLGTPLDTIETIKFTCSEEGTQIPLAIKSPEMMNGVSNDLMSIMSLNEIICSLLNKRRFVEPKNEFIKIQRSATYNPESRFLLEKVGKEQELKAFEAFVFKNGYKLVVYEDGFVRLWNQKEEPIIDMSEQNKLLAKVKPYITVTDCI